MTLTRRAVCRCGFIFFLLLFSFDAAYSQEFPHTYLFVEVKDTSGTAVADATVNVDRDNSFDYVQGERDVLIRDLKTDKAGAARRSLYYGPYAPDQINLQISKSGYLPYENLFSRLIYRPFFGVEKPSSNAAWYFNDHAWHFNIVLLKTPETPSERRAIEPEQKRRQLLLAVKKGDATNVLSLLRAGVNANATDELGASAIAWAAFMGHAGVIEALLDAGANVRAKDNPGHDALMLYLNKGLVYCHSRAGEKGDKAGLELCDEVIRSLIKAGAAVNPRNPYLEPTLFMALYRSPDYVSVETLKALIRAGASVNAWKEDGYTPLMYAAQNSPPEVIKALLDAGLPVNGRDKQGSTALILAARSSRYGIEAIKVLVQAGADINAVNNDGWTALMEASTMKGGSYEAQTVAFLLKARAKVNLVDKTGQTALMIAKETGNMAIVKLLEEAERRQ